MSQVTFRATIPQIMSAIRIGSDICRLTLDIPASDVPNAVPLIALQNVVLRVTIEVDGATSAIPQKPTKVKEQKGPHSAFWHEFFRRRVNERADLCDVLDCLPGAVHDRLHQELNVASLSNVAPDAFEKWASSKQLHGLITKSREISAEMPQ